jgi:hypothetical protein
MSHQNGVTEQKNKTILNMSRSLTNVTHLPSFLWAKSINIAIFLVNITPSHSNLGLTPYHILTSDKLDVNMLHIFGSVCYFHINSQKIKLDNKSVVGAFLGYDLQSKGFRIFIIASKKFIVSKDVKFDESKIFFQKDFWVIFTSACDSICFSSFQTRSYNVVVTPSLNLGYFIFKFTFYWGSSYVFFNRLSKFP